MADAATWADDERNVEKTTERWHFIDIPLAVSAESVPEKDAMKWCPPASDGRPGCIVTALDYEWAILRDANRPAAARAQALRYLIHFVGDDSAATACERQSRSGRQLHQHRILRGAEAAESAQHLGYQLIARELEADKLTQPRYAGKTRRGFLEPMAGMGRIEDGFFRHGPGTATGSRQTVAYGDLKPQIPIEPATAGQADKEACNLEREKVAALRISIGDEYAAQAMPVIREQLAKAGYRLAGLLNQAFQ